MNPESAPPVIDRRRRLATVAVLLVIITAFGAYLRFAGLGVRSLWHDEFCTWHVSQMPLGESLRWAPEIIPPLYQFSVRLVTNDAHPSEWVLRFPAAVCGVLTILAAGWLGRQAGGWSIGLSLAALVACCPSQIEYSQEARSYTMLMLGTVLSVVLWRRVVEGGRWKYIAAYSVATAATLHAHYLCGLTIIAEILWAVFWWLRHRTRAGRPLLALSFAGLLCVPLLIQRLSARNVIHGLTWVDPATFRRTFAVLTDLTFGVEWLVVLAASLVLAGFTRRISRRYGGDRGGLSRNERSTLLLLGLWLGVAWLGLVVISWLGQPALVERYALPAAAPALLIPLLVARYWHKYAPPIVALLIIVAAAPEWVLQATEYESGFRELSAYLRENADPVDELTVLAADGTVDPRWTETERLAFAYYPPDDRTIHVVRFDPATPPEPGSVLFDPRPLNLVVFRGDPRATLTAAGREIQPIQFEGDEYTRLPFAAYRLIRVAGLGGS